MPSNSVVDVTPACLWKASKASRRGKATAKQVALTQIEAELEELVTDRKPDELIGSFNDMTAIIQRFHLEADGALHVDANIPARFATAASELPDSLGRLLDALGELRV